MEVNIENIKATNNTYLPLLLLPFMLINNLCNFVDDISQDLSARYTLEKQHQQNRLCATLLLFVFHHYQNNVPSWLPPQRLCGNSCTWLQGTMYGYLLLIPTNKRVLNKLNKQHNVSNHK